MNKLLTIILLLSLSLAFYSCSDDNKEDDKFVWNGDWNDPDDKNYKPEGYNPIEGLWKNDKDGTKGAYFSEDFKDYQVTFLSNGDYTLDLFRNKYIINDKAFKYSNGDIWRYKVEGNILYLNPSLISENDVRKYIKVVE